MSTVWSSWIFIMHGFRMAFLCASLLPYAVNDNGPGLAELERVFREQVCGCSSLQRPWGPAAIISHSFCPLSLAGSRSIHRWRSFQALSKGHNKRLHRQASLSLNIQYTHKCTQQTHSYAILFCFSLFLMWPYLFSHHPFQVYFGLVSKWGGVSKERWAAHCERD